MSALSREHSTRQVFRAHRYLSPTGNSSEHSRVSSESLTDILNITPVPKQRMLQTACSLEHIGPKVRASYLIVPCKTPWNRLRTKKLSIATSILNNYRQQTRVNPSSFLLSLSCPADLENFDIARCSHDRYVILEVNQVQTETYSFSVKYG